MAVKRHEHDFSIVDDMWPNENEHTIYYQCERDNCSATYSETFKITKRTKVHDGDKEEK